MVALADLVAYTDRLLNDPALPDGCPNGLQIAGREQVQTLASGVTASLALIDAAIEAGADALLVHHGYFWKNEDPRLIGMKKQRIARLLAADISLIAYHLPLDRHPIYGNNAQLARLLEIQPESTLPAEPLVWLGSLQHPCDGGAFAERIAARLRRIPLHIPAQRPIRRLAWCSGGAQGYIEAAARAGVDAYLTGEVSEYTVHIAREYGIHFYAAGHHATERYGAAALGEHLAREFGLSHRFIEIENPA
jgi:dinuclear metal center YbgI/SA1388 family protein